MISDIEPSQLNFALLPRSATRAGRYTLIARRRVSGTGYLSIPVLDYYPDSSMRSIQFTPLVLYFCEFKNKSYTWMSHVAIGVALLIEFSIARNTHYQELRLKFPRVRIASKLFKDFAKALLHGTLSSLNGNLHDADGLWWTPRSSKNAVKHLNAVIAFLQWADESDGTNILAAAGLSVELFEPIEAMRFNFNYSTRQNVRFLNHVKRLDKKVSINHLTADYTTLQEVPQVNRFPAEHVGSMIIKGFRVAGQTEELDLNAMLIATILFMGGLRSCEPFHFWVNDFVVTAGKPLLFLSHPVESKVKMPGEGMVTRSQYLSSVGLFPRNRVRGTFHAGWKAVAGDMNGARAHWLDVDGIDHYLATYLTYYVTVYRPKIMFARRAKGLRDHPYLFVGNGDGWGSEHTDIGDPYTLAAFRAAWKSAVDRLRNETNDPRLIYSKGAGTTPHGARHFYGNRVIEIAKDSSVLMKTMHHHSPFSQMPYLQRRPEETDAAIRGDERAIQKNNENIRAIERSLLNWRFPH